MSKKTEQDFFERPDVRRVLWWLLWGSCALTVLLELWWTPPIHFHFADFFGFEAVLGFVSCAVLIVGAKLLGYLLKKPEDYYDR
ncbi:hypothetical protein dsx2_1247 [Desulfovibrio sp. X2]|uniref:hypothetical protein n=1 Tax=Desulfovibrio sp. X2 TaxID=941449 RepID=UPI000358950F|nr:hypothetical protein [Desulfovibrio sp. X2]EPR36330.1 hypothetical protein dsx2_1247 [Desulfovibrio sp. X2]